MLEWYGVGTTLEDQMQLVEDLVRALIDSVRQNLTAAEDFRNQYQVGPDAFVRTSYEAAFRRCAAGGVLDLDDRQLLQLARQRKLSIPDSESEMNRDDLLNLMLATLVEPRLGKDCPEFLFAYPASQAALAATDPRDPRTALRFELYMDGVELCNGYQELTDPDELTRRDQQHNAHRAREDRVRVPGAPRLQAAMSHGLPACSGVALGLDRLLMLALGTDDIRNVIPFPYENA